MKTISSKTLSDTGLESERVNFKVRIPCSNAVFNCDKLVAVYTRVLTFNLTLTGGNLLSLILITTSTTSGAS